MNSNQSQPSRLNASTQSTRNASLASPSHSGTPFHPANPMRTPAGHSKAFTPPSLHPNYPSPIHTPSSATVVPSPLSARTPAASSSSMGPPPVPLPPVQSSPTPLSHNPLSVPSKRFRECTPNLPTLPARYLSTELSSERPVKRQRLGLGSSGTTADHGGLQPPVSRKQSPPSKPSTVSVTPPDPKPRQERVLPHPLAVDWSRPVTFADPRPSSWHLNPRRDRVPVCPYAENPDPERLLDEELRGPVDPKVAKELGNLMWVQQMRVRANRRSYTDYWPFIPVSASALGNGSLSMSGEFIPPKPPAWYAALYGPASRNNESIRLGESLTNPSVTVPGDDDDGFEGVLDLYRGAVQGSGLSRELELEVGGIGNDAELIGGGWEGASSLEISIKGGAPADTTHTGTQESRISTLAEYRRVVEAEKGEPSSKPGVPKEDPPLGIEWSYSCCGYATGKVVNPKKARHS